MQTVTLDCEVTAERTLTVRLPPTVSPGRHRIALLIDPPESPTAATDLPPMPDSEPPRTPLYARLSALRHAALLAGELPAPMNWDGILAEVQRRRGE